MECVYKPDCSNGRHICSLQRIFKYHGSPTHSEDTTNVRVAGRLLSDLDHIRDGEAKFTEPIEAESYHSFFSKDNSELSEYLGRSGKNLELLTAIEAIDREVPILEAASVEWKHYFNRLAELGSELFVTGTNLPDKTFAKIFGYAYYKFMTMTDSLVDLEKDEEAGNFNPFIDITLQEKEEVIHEIKYLQEYLVTEKTKAQATPISNDERSDLPFVDPFALLNRTVSQAICGSINSQSRHS